MDPACLAYCLTEEDRRQFNEQGYLVVEDALPEDTLEGLVGAIDRVDAEERQRRGNLRPHDSLTMIDFAGRDPALFEMVDWPRTFPKVWGLLGWNIYLYHTHLAVNPAVAPEQRGGPMKLGWHQDSGRLNVEMEVPRPRLSLKIGYFLTDLTTPGRGNFWIVPGSHRWDILEQPVDGGHPPGAVPVCVRAGTAVFFDRRLWHAASPNVTEGTARKVLFYGYGYRWIRPRDDMTIPPEWIVASDPIRRQLCGASTGNMGYSSPSDEDVPLRVWLRQHRPQDTQ